MSPHEQQFRDVVVVQRNKLVYAERRHIAPRLHRTRVHRQAVLPAAYTPTKQNKIFRYFPGPTPRKLSIGILISACRPEQIQASFCTSVLLSEEIMTTTSRKHFGPAAVRNRFFCKPSAHHDGFYIYASVRGRTHPCQAQRASKACPLQTPRRTTPRQIREEGPARSWCPPANLVANLLELRLMAGFACPGWERRD